MYQPKILMDSGAWSAWTRGTPIDLGRYCDFLHQEKDWIAHAIALDMICPEDTALAAETGFKNWQYMRSRGLEPMAVLHNGEDIKWLHKYLDAGCTYLGLGALSLPMKRQRFAWYEIVWAHLVNSDGLPVIRVHALGDTNEASLRAFPWTSCDSSSWFYISQVLGQFRLDDGSTIGFGNKARKGKRDIRDLEDPKAAEALLRKHGIKADAFDDRVVTVKTFPDDEVERRTIARMLAARGLLTVRSYQDMALRINTQVPVRYRPPRGFAGGVTASSLPAWPGYDQFTLYLVSGKSGTQHPVLYRANHDRVLVSYAYFMEDERRAYQATKWFAEDAKAMIYEQSTARIVAVALDEVMAEAV
jgi:hypothetical protein